MAKILIIDDNINQLNANRLLLINKFPNDEILTCENEDDATLLITNTDNLDVIITDLSMKNVTGGIQILKVAKEKDLLIMVILLTAYEVKLDRSEAFRLGAFDCLIKGSVGVKTGDELTYKIKNALVSRERALSLLELETDRRINNLKKYFDPFVFEKIKLQPDLLLPKFKTVTIVFWDIRGFSSLTEKLQTEPSLVADFLKEYFEIASDIIFRNKGVVDKFIGDGIMALFGVFDDSVDNENQNAIAAVNAAKNLKIEFNNLFTVWCNKWRKVTSHSIDFIGLGCGMTTGKVIVGNLGTDSRDHFTAVGAHVNFAARIESTSKKDEIRISQTTKERISNLFEIKFLESVENIKNIPGKFDIYGVQ